MNFGKYAIADGVTHNFEQEPSWWWKIKPITGKMELEMSKFLAHNRIYVIRGERHEQPPTTLEIAFREIALSFGGTNIPKDVEKPVESGGEPFVSPDQSVELIEEAIGNMPREMVMEVWKAIGSAHPYWGPADPNVV